jgi:hypothetical protein
MYISCIVAIIFLEDWKNYQLETVISLTSQTQHAYSHLWTLNVKVYFTYSRE